MATPNTDKVKIRSRLKPAIGTFEEGKQFPGNVAAFPIPDTRQVLIISLNLQLSGDAKRNFIVEFITERSKNCNDFEN